MECKSDERITVCIPAYRSSLFIAETLESLQAQTFKNFEAIISIDGNDEETLQKCQVFLKDPRFKVIVQEERLGWVQNTNWLLARAEGPFVSILPHDDLIHPYYLEEMIRHLQKHPECALVYCDTAAFSEESGFHQFYFIQPSLKGSQQDRMLGYLTHNFECVGFRSLIQKKALDLAGFLENNPFQDFAADTLWLGKMAKQGELHRLPYFLCRKRYHPNNTHLKWFKESKAHQRAAWNQHCDDLLNQFIQGVVDLDEKQQLIKAAKDRFKRGCSRFHICQT